MVGAACSSSVVAVEGGIAANVGTRRLNVVLRVLRHTGSFAQVAFCPPEGHRRRVGVCTGASHQPAAYAPLRRRLQYIAAP